MERLERLLAETFGFQSFRPHQREAMEAALSGRDSLLVMPTGGGKSLTYQAPALLRGGTTLVVSPLISLMEDQVAGLKENGVAAGLLSSTQPPEEAAEVRRRLRSGELRLLYVAPERLLMEGFLASLDAVEIRAVVIDEAHCISQWGHDFRPEYRRLAELRDRFPDASFHACTATATRRVRRDVVESLRLSDAIELVGSFDRPNLTYRFQPRTDRLAQVRGVIARHEGEAGIIYAQRRADVDTLAASLAKDGLRVLPYHAGLGDEERRANQEAFLSERCDIVVATVAFGMGIDRPDVRFVLHAAMPRSIEHYLQESGRAGRDGDPAECVLLFSGADFHGWKGMIEREGDHVDRGPAIERLAAMYAIASGARCRHKELLAWFGEGFEADSCEACDVCLGELPRIADGTRLAQMVLSCVYRVGQRFGAGHVIDVLRGQTTDRVLRLGHDRLSTFGLLPDTAAKLLRGVCDQLVGKGLLEVSSGDYPTLRLTERAGPVLRGEEEVVLLSPPAAGGGGARTRRKAAVEDEDPLTPADEVVFEDLRDLRRELAAARSVRPYMIFSDRTLRELCRQRPLDEEALGRIHGIGETKLRQIGGPILERLREHQGDAAH